MATRKTTPKRAKKRPAKRATIDNLYIGTSGWMYKDWGKRFYPPDMKSGFLEFLSREFNTVEVNSSFYHLPRASIFAKWKSETPAHFRFAVKLSRYITHRKKLLKCEEALINFCTAAKELKEKLSVVLIQLPPSLAYDEARLMEFLDDLTQAVKKTKIRARFALEPRHPSWMEQGSERVKELLAQNKMALVFPHSAAIPSFAPEDENVLTDFIYIRFHGPSEFAASRYGVQRLASWAKRIKTWLARDLSVYCYFNNDVHGHAVDDARALKKLCGES